MKVWGVERHQREGVKPPTPDKSSTVDTGIMHYISVWYHIVPKQTYRLKYIMLYN